MTFYPLYVTITRTVITGPSSEEVKDRKVLAGLIPAGLPQELADGLARVARTVLYLRARAANTKGGKITTKAHFGAPVVISITID